MWKGRGLKRRRSTSMESDVVRTGLIARYVRVQIAEIADTVEMIFR